MPGRTAASRDDLNNGVHMKPYHELTEDERYEFGREIVTDPTCVGFMRQGRPITNVEMNACTFYLSEERRKAEQFLKEEL